MRSSSLVLAASVGSAAAFGVGPAALPASSVAVRAPAAAMMAERWNDPILDESKPDPVWDDKSPYKGRVPYGFSNSAEKLNGRAAMMGFTILFLQELITGKGVLELCKKNRQNTGPCSPCLGVTAAVLLSLCTCMGLLLNRENCPLPFKCRRPSLRRGSCSAQVGCF